LARRQRRSASRRLEPGRRGHGTAVPACGMGARSGPRRAQGPVAAIRRARRQVVVAVRRTLGRWPRPTSLRRVLGRCVTSEPDGMRWMHDAISSPHRFATTPRAFRRSAGRERAGRSALGLRQVTTTERTAHRSPSRFLSWRGSRQRYVRRQALDRSSQKMQRR
jgi:hypothetical protein